MGGWVYGLVRVCMGFESVGYSDRKGVAVGGGRHDERTAQGIL